MHQRAAFTLFPVVLFLQDPYGERGARWANWQNWEYWSQWWIGTADQRRLNSTREIIFNSMPAARRLVIRTVFPLPRVSFAGRPVAATANGGGSPQWCSVAMRAGCTTLPDGSAEPRYPST